jgi:hypothetical protein
MGIICRNWPLREYWGKVLKDIDSDILSYKKFEKYYNGAINHVINNQKSKIVNFFNISGWGANSNLESVPHVNSREL